MTKYLKHKGLEILYFLVTNQLHWLVAVFTILRLPIFLSSSQHSLSILSFSRINCCLLGSVKSMFSWNAASVRFFMDINIFICLVKAIYHNKFLYINVLGVGGWLVHFIQVFFGLFDNSVRMDVAKFYEK